MKIMVGKVISNKMEKTVVVEVESLRPHPIYKKIVRKRKRIKAESGGLNLKIGDKVKIISTRPISKEKHFKVIEKIEN